MSVCHTVLIHVFLSVGLEGHTKLATQQINLALKSVYGLNGHTTLCYGTSMYRYDESRQHVSDYLQHVS